MGLDMYLKKKTYIKNWDHTPEENLHYVIIKKGDTIREDIKQKRISEIVEDIMYWRKANHIHKWFVDSIQSGEDDCREYYVNRDDLEKLVKLCQDILKFKAGDLDPRKILPVFEGFFFGGYTYDEWYYEACKRTIDIVGKALLEEDGDFYYQSSW